MKFELTNTNERRVADQKITFTRCEDEDVKHIGPEMFQEKFYLDLRIRTTFWSNGAQLERQKEQAKKATRAHLFRDMIPVVEEILLETSSQEVRALALSLRSMMIEGTNT